MKLKYSLIYLIAFMSVLFTGTKAYCEQKTPMFNDIKDFYAEDSINKLVKAGIISGVTSQEFCPDKNLTRYDFAVLIAKTLGIQPFFPSEPTFSDIPSGTLETGYLEALFKLGLIKGVDQNHFGANQPLLRQDAAVLLYRALAEKTEVPSLKGRYTDLEQLASYAEKAVAYATWKGWLAGSENRFYPLREITRAEASVLAYRLFQMRKEQAATVINASARIRLGTDETRQLEQGKTQNPLPFTTSYGTDNQVICSITPDSTLFSGQEQGTGLITVNGGYNYYTVITDVYSTETKVNNAAPGDMTKPLLVEQSDSHTTYTVGQHEPDPVNQQLEHKNYSAPVEGLFSKSDTWTGFLQQKGRDITVDLKKLCAVSNISMEFRQNSGLRIYLPEYLQVSISSDGVIWYHLGYAYHGVKPFPPEDKNLTLALTFPTVNARYLKLSFPVELRVFARHLSIKGGLPATKPALLAHAELKNNSGMTGAYMQVPDCKDILLIYTGYNSFKTDWTSEDFLPVIAYLNKNGLLEGRMFDTMLFIPYMFEVPCTKAGWNSYMKNLFTQRRQLSALDAAVEQLNKITGRQDKEKVILTIPYPDLNQQDFGQLEDGGPSLSFSEAQLGKEQATQNRFTAVKWYYNNLMDAWNRAGFKNLELLGIYWCEGSVNHYSIAGEKELVQKTAGLVRDNGQNFFWIPYYGAVGLGDWKALGFTHAFIQPGYYNREYTPVERIDKAAELARKYNMGIEIQFDDEILSERYFNDLLHNQLDKAHQLGLDGNTTRAYYMGLRAVLNCAHSKSPQARTTYENLYKWLNGSYQ